MMKEEEKSFKEEVEKIMRKDGQARISFKRI